MVRHLPIILSLIATGAPLIPSQAAAMAPAAATPSAVAAADRYVTVEGIRFRVREEGPRTAPPIILIHGFTFSLESWDGWAADLARDHRVIRFDLAGHGLSGSAPDGDYGTAARVRQLGKLMDRLRVRRATIAGNSFGGLVAWNFAVASPARVDRLVLVDSAAYSINGVTEKPVAVPPVMRGHLLDPSPAGIAYSAANIFARPERLSAARLEQMRAMIVRNGPALIAHLEQFTLPDPAAALARIKAPTLVLWGSADKVIPVAQATALAAAIPNARLITYDEVGHAPQEEATASTLTDLRAFLKQNK